MSEKRKPTAATLLLEARKEPKRQQYVSASDLGAVLSVLRDKGLSWKEIADWCAKRGYRWSGSNCKAGWIMWQKRRAQKKGKS